MSALDDWRAAQREDEVTPSDIRMAMWLEQLDPTTVRLDHAAHMSSPEIAHLRGLGLHRRAS